MRFIHLADVHLGAVPDRGCPWSKEREEEIWSTFRRVIAGIREDPVDLLFISGDLFHRQPLMRELKEVNYLFSTIPDTRVYLMAGNRPVSRTRSWMSMCMDSAITTVRSEKACMTRRYRCRRRESIFFLHMAEMRNTFRLVQLPWQQQALIMWHWDI